MSIRHTAHWIAVGGVTPPTGFKPYFVQESEVLFGMKKNVSGQTISAQMTTISDGTPFTGTVTTTVTKDGGTQTAGGGTVTHEGGGEHSYAPTQAETNADFITFKFSGTGALSSGKEVYTDFPQTVDNATDISSVKSTVEKVPLSDGVISWNSTALASINAEADTALTDYDGPTNAEMITRTLLGVEYTRNLGQGIAQGGTASTIQLASGESFAINELRGNVVSITEGTGAGQSRWISANTGAATDTASIVPDWITTPDATSDYEITPGPASVQAFLDTLITETVTGRIADNVGTFYNNAGTLTDKVVDDVGAGTLFPSAAWTWSTATTGVPLAGRLRGNNATIASITQLDIHQETVDGRNAGLIISALRDGDKILVAFDVNPDVFLVFDVSATPVLTGSVYAVTGTVSSTAGSFVNSRVTVSYNVTGNTEAAVANREEMDANSVDLNTLITGQTTINDNVLLIPTTAMRGTDDALLATNVPTNFSSMVISGAGAVDSLMQGILNTLLTEITAGRIAGNFDVFFENADALTTKVVDDVGGAGGGLTAQQTRDAMKLAPTGGAPSAGSIDEHLDDVLEDTGTTLPAQISALNNITADSVLQAGDIDGFTLEEAQKLILSASAGILAGAATTTVTIKAADGSKTRITATVDSDGNRSSVIKDASG